MRRRAKVMAWFSAVQAEAYVRASLHMRIENNRTRSSTSRATLFYLRQLASSEDVERDELRLAVRAAEALTAAAERRLSDAEADSAAMRARLADLEHEAEEARAAHAAEAQEVARLSTALQALQRGSHSMLLL
eukprot:jgi/Ulvmu1/3434/UM016_0053.1